MTSGGIGRIHHFESESTWLPVCRTSWPHLLTRPGPDWCQGEFNPPEKAAQSASHGWYAWKPWALCQVLDQVQDGTVLLYTDCDTSKYVLLADTFTDDVRPACAELLTVHGDFFCPTNCDWKHGPMCKRICLEAMGATSDEYLEALQLQATFFLCRASTYSRRLAREWLEWSTDVRGLISGAPSPGGMEHPRFRVHRHDQAILTTLLLREQFAGRLPASRPYKNSRFLPGVIAELRGVPYAYTDRLVALARQGERAALASVLEFACAFHAGNEAAQRKAVSERLSKLSDGLNRQQCDHLNACTDEVIGVLIRRYHTPRR